MQHTTAPIFHGKKVKDRSITNKRKYFLHDLKHFDAGLDEETFCVFKISSVSLFSAKPILKVLSSFQSLMSEGFVRVCNEVYGWNYEWMDECLCHSVSLS